jgi:hypothetical protein
VQKKSASSMGRLRGCLIPKKLIRSKKKRRSIMSFKNMKIGVRLYILVGFFIVLLMVVGIMGLSSMKKASDGLETVYNDRVVPLRDLKVIADMYAVNIVDTSHKVRNGKSSSIKNGQPIWRLFLLRKRKS